MVNSFIDNKNGCIYHSGTGDGDGSGTKLKNFTCDSGWKKNGYPGNIQGDCTFPKGFISVNPPCPNNGTLVTTDNTCKTYKCFNTDAKGYSQCMAYTTPTQHPSGGCPFGDKTVNPINSVCPHYCTTGENLASLVCKGEDKKDKISAYCDCSIISCPSGATLEKS